MLQKYLTITSSLTPTLMFTKSLFPVRFLFIGQNWAGEAVMLDQRGKIGDMCSNDLT